jgi:hypothetical protein
MKTLVITALAAAAVLAAVLSGIALAAKEPDLQGNYLLVKRDLPDGSSVAPPKVVGFMTFTRKYRNMNVAWKEKDGKMVSLSYLAEYSVADRKYCETPLYWMQNNLMADGISYTPPGEKNDCSAVTFDAGATVVALKGEPVAIRLAGDDLIATAKGMFVDHWKRVD